MAELSPPAARDEIPDRLRGLVRRELLRPAPARLGTGGGYQFRHQLVRDAVYDAVPRQARAELHERLAGLLEARAGARVREYEEIVGYQLEQAHQCLAALGPVDRRGRELGVRAAGRLGPAGRRALGRGDAPAATTLLTRAVVLLPAGHPQRPFLLTDLADSFITTGDYRRGDQTLNEAVAAAAPQDTGLRAHVLVTRLQMRLTTEPELEFERLHAEVEKAIAVLERLGDDRGLARACRLLGYERFVSCRIEQAEQAIAKLIEHARRATDERLEAYGRGMLTSAAFWGPLPASDAIERCRRQLAEADGNRPYLNAVYGQFAAAVELLAGRPDAAEAWLADGYRALERLGETGERSNVAADLAYALLAQDRAAEALRYAETCQALAARDDLYAQVRWRDATARVLAAEGRDGEAEELAREAVALAERTDMLNLRAGALLDLTEAARAGDRVGDAVAATRRALSLYERKGNLAAAAMLRAVTGAA